MPMSVRLDSKTESLVNRLARKTGRTKSEIIREALARLADEEGERHPGRSPYEATKHLIGITHGGPPDLSVRSGEKVRALLRARARRS